ncbi:Unknown protein [Striga hermonthica]|uniref:Uncharacterized protein n=1 Tax=Striga hermonthica TaxID=68872 RepID=A0A9N7MTS4_STRHE|nr:Unknown protein [Striga hermonthica]
MFFTACEEGAERSTFPSLSHWESALASDSGKGSRFTWAQTLRVRIGPSLSEQFPVLRMPTPEFREGIAAFDEVRPHLLSEEQRRLELQRESYPHVESQERTEAQAPSLENLKRLLNAHESVAHTITLICREVNTIPLGEFQGERLAEIAEELYGAERMGEIAESLQREGGVVRRAPLIIVLGFVRVPWKDFPSMRDVYLFYDKISHRGGVPNVIPLYLESQKEWKPPFDLLNGK